MNTVEWLERCIAPRRELRRGSGGCAPGDQSKMLHKMLHYQVLKALHKMFFEEVACLPSPPYHTGLKSSKSSWNAVKYPEIVDKNVDKKNLTSPCSSAVGFPVLSVFLQDFLQDFLQNFLQDFLQDFLLEFVLEHWTGWCGLSYWVYCRKSNTLTGVLVEFPEV